MSVKWENQVANVYAICEKYERGKLAAIDNPALAKFYIKRAIKFQKRAEMYRAMAEETA